MLEFIKIKINEIQENNCKFKTNDYNYNLYSWIDYSTISSNDKRKINILVLIISTATVTECVVYRFISFTYGNLLQYWQEMATTSPSWFENSITPQVFTFNAILSDLRVG